MKKKTNTNYSGIVICDSIVMSVRQKRRNFRKPEALIIAVLGFVSVVMSFLNMFEFSYNPKSVFFFSVIFSVLYAGIAFSGKRTLWITGASFLLFAIGIYRFFETILDGFKYVYNVIYSDAKHTSILYYKYLDPDNEYFCTTVFFIFCVWLIAMAVYVFTIYKPNPLIVIGVTFPIIEIGLYNGIKIPVFWGILTVGYWMALAAMYGIDLGEYYGGNGGFVRKENLFFPKRQMRLKVTEKCACIILLTVTAVTACTMALINFTDYERSESLKQKRIDIKEAANSFSMDDLASSVSAITEAFGFTISYETHKLGNLSHIQYKNVTDMTATFDRSYDGAIYLKGYAGAVYQNNEWTELDDSVYDKSSLFDEFKSSGIYPQDFPHILSQDSSLESSDITVWLEAKRKKNKTYAPYGTNNYGGLSYDYDMTVSSKSGGEESYSYKFTGIDKSNVLSLIKNAAGNDNPQLETAETLENEYRSFVYDNYLQIPDNESMNAVRDTFADILNTADAASSSEEKLELLETIREKINSMTEYTLSPGETPSNRDFVNYFLLENHKGYCIHYATAGVILARMAGIPARYATGYIIVGDDFSEDNLNSDGTYTIDVQDNRSHAWAEIYLDGLGWIPFEFTKGYSGSSIDTSQETAEATSEVQTAVASSETSVTNQTLSKNSNVSNTSKSNSEERKTTIAETSSVTTESTVEVQNNDSPYGRYIFCGLSGVFSIFILIYLRRYIIISIRRRHFTQGSNGRRTAYMYEYAESLFKFLKFSKGKMQYTEYANYLETMLASRYFAAGELKEFMDIVLEGSFGRGDLSSDRTQIALQFVRNLSKTVYTQSSTFKKIKMKLILVLI